MVGFILDIFVHLLQILEHSLNCKHASVALGLEWQCYMSGTAFDNSNNSFVFFFLFYLLNFLAILQ